MNLATRCQSCGTVFRVMLGQLQTSDGWVRCGRCDSVFNATDMLFDIDNGAALPADRVAFAGPASLPGPGGQPASPHLDLSMPPPGRGDPSLHDEPLLRAPSSDHDDDIHIVDQQPTQRPPPEADPLDGPLGRLAGLDGLLGRGSMGASGTPAYGDGASTAARYGNDVTRGARQADSGPVAARYADGAASGARYGDGAASGTRRAEAVPSVPPWAPGGPPSVDPSSDFNLDLGPPIAAPASPAKAAHKPSFVKDSERAARWRYSPKRAVLAGSVLLAGGALVLQAAVLARDRLAAHWPRSAPALAGLCSVLGCEVQPLRQIDALVVGSSGLNRVDGSTLYRLQLVLRNRANIAVMAPAVDLSLTDTQGHAVARRVLYLSDLGVAEQQLKPGQDLPIKVLMSSGERRVDGYTVELFYP